MSLARRSFPALLLIAILLASCGAPAAGEPTPNVEETIAAGAQTMVAAVFETQTAAAPTATQTALPTVTAAPTTSPLAIPSPFITVTQSVIFFASPTPTGTFYTATPGVGTLSYGCNNLLLIESFTDPAGPFKQGDKFTQSWQVANVGTCDWLYLYELVHVSGDRLGGNTQRLDKKIEPKKWTTLSVQLEAPQKAGTYTASWRFTDGAGHGFGSTLPVSITVKKDPDPTATVDAAATAIAGTVAAQLTQTASSQQTAISVGQTAIACQTNIAGGTPPPCP
jgi:hypothetical protein